MKLSLIIDLMTGGTETSKVKSIDNGILNLTMFVIRVNYGFSK